MEHFGRGAQGIDDDWLTGVTAGKPAGYTKGMSVSRRLARRGIGCVQERN
jgi:hypothetical protein